MIWWCEVNECVITDFAVPKSYQIIIEMPLMRLKLGVRCQTILINLCMLVRNLYWYVILKSKKI